ncbi:flagellar type III secretion system pore protein FliP [Polynucleobacter sp. MG-6-Vaara-E2]|uniref:flagellar type III secretion system pore protein FliP n=1 Tax=Polynucleobacter sp. MG-6-Vaara-E2 TaxID=2576932 RepID=UPI001BFE0669|nr:flagellar type III secretion system pore protein FliP [Polynucleobacter sp. MG-6-Vaara-E2]QWD96024.1 flagellar type III secretion system pore protein FliP [Polynucleobacter sp. MG-6-Vaara-E2]
MKNKNTFFITGAIGLLGFFPLIAWSQTLPLVTAKQAGGGTLYSVPVETLLAITALSFLPAALVLMTSFTRILIVFSLLRQALGLTTMPPNIVLIGLSLFLTLFIMNPVFDSIYKNAYQPYSIGKMGFPQAVEVGAKPLKEFMLKQTRKDDLNLFVKMYGKEIQAREDVPFTVLIPAFAISEIKTGFLIGFVIFLPFLVIDFAVASILTSLGMVMVSPMMFSLPIKLIVFTLADGWALLSTSLVQSYIN